MVWIKLTNFLLQGVKILCQHSYDTRFIDSSQVALKCLANTLLIESKTRQMVVNLGYADKAAMKLKVESSVVLPPVYGSNKILE